LDATFIGLFFKIARGMCYFFLYLILISLSVGWGLFKTLSINASLAQAILSFLLSLVLSSICPLSKAVEIS
jgi:hypothetical protein